MQVTMKQHAVGQGGLFSGELRSDRQSLRYVYDCGSNQRDALLREIKVMAAWDKIELLFLSHLDSDHINGVDQLLMQVKVREVVLPYLDETMLLATVARDAARGSLTGAFVEAVEDLDGWFGSRGVETITFVSGSDDDEDDGDPDLGEPGSDEGELSTNWTRSPVPIVKRPSTPTHVGAGARAKMQRVPHSATLRVMTTEDVLSWSFIPHVHLPSIQKMQAFDRVLAATFGSPLNKKHIAARAKEAKDRDKLRDCYDALWSDHNLVTMTLYSGPLEQRHALICLSYSRSHSEYWNGLGGWILTGDAHLNQRRRSQRFLQYYKRVIPFTRVLMLPHHGSQRNHCDHVIAAMPDLMIGYAAAGPNSYGHPHPAVKDAVNTHANSRFHHVSEKLSSMIIMRQFL